MRVGAAVGKEDQLRECVGAFGAAEEGCVAWVGGVLGEGGGQVGCVAEGAGDGHAGGWQSWW